MAQRYSDPAALSRMSRGTCPECGETASNHMNDSRFWMPRRCDLLPSGVADRLAQYEADVQVSA